MAALVPNLDSFDDAFITANYAIASAPNLNVTIPSDAARCGPSSSPRR